MRQILTDALCRTKPPRTGRLEIADLRQAGLVLRITSNGARSFAYRFRHPHTRKTPRATIGGYPAASLENARTRPASWPLKSRLVAIQLKVSEQNARPPQPAHSKHWRIGTSKNMPSGTSARVRPKKIDATLPFISCQSGASAIFAPSDALTQLSLLNPSLAPASTLPAIACTHSSQSFFLLHSIAI